MRQNNSCAEVTRLSITVFLISASLLGFEITLMRMLLLASWHHFAFLIISVVLVSFGASGSLAFVLQRWLLPRYQEVMAILSVFTALSVPGTLRIAEHLPFEARLIPDLLFRELGFWFARWVVMSLPFLLGSLVITIALMKGRKLVARVYSANLFGSAFGAVFSISLFAMVPLERLPIFMACGALLAAFVNWRMLSKQIKLVLVCVSLLTAYLLCTGEPNVRTDEYKYASFVKRLESQGSVKRLRRVYGVRGVWEAYEGSIFHDIAFLSPGIEPPPMLSVLHDGHLAGSLLQISSLTQAQFLDNTLMALAYDLATANPSVLLINEIAGVNVWLALIKEAKGISIVQPDETLYKLMQRPKPLVGSEVFQADNVHKYIDYPRHFLDHSVEQFDLIQLVNLQSIAVGESSLRGLAEDYLLTTQGISASFSRLNDEGLLFACHGIQTPARNNVKLLATFTEALKINAITNPAEHIVIVRDYLAVCTLIKKSPWSKKQINSLRSSIRNRELTPVWFPGISTAELNTPDELQSPPGQKGDWYYYSARKLFSDEAREFMDKWAFDIRPATDARPFFYDFFTFRSLGILRQAFGALWLTRTEMAFLVVLLTTVIIALISSVLILFPLTFVRQRTGNITGGKGIIFGYFAALGLAYMLLEMTFISRFIHLIGDPVVATSTTIAGFLFWSGIGSLQAHRMGLRQKHAVPVIIATLIIVAVIELIVLSSAHTPIGLLPLELRAVAAFAVMAPMAFFMGFLMPFGLMQLERSNEEFIPWAWGVNGFASVIAPPLAILIAMTWGYSLVAVSALCLYAVSGVMFRKL